MEFDREPYFMSDPEWYEETSEGNRAYKLTDKAPQKAVDSFDAFFKIIESDDPTVKFDKTLTRLAFD